MPTYKRFEDLTAWQEAIKLAEGCEDFIIEAKDYITQSKRDQIDRASLSVSNNIAKACLDYGQHVQNSVFECKLDPAHYVALKEQILNEIDPSTDSIRIYNLGNNWQKQVEHFGKNHDYNIEGTLLV